MYAVVDDMLIAGIVVDVYCDTTQGGDFRGEFGEAGVVLPEGEGGGLVGLRLRVMGREGKEGPRGQAYCSRSYASDILNALKGRPFEEEGQDLGGADVC